MSITAIDLESAVDAMRWLFLIYFIAMNCGYLLLNLLSIGGLKRSLEANMLQVLRRPASDYEPPVSIIMPARGQAAAINDSVHALLRLDYPEHEVIVVVDRSQEATLAILKHEFKLALFPEAYWKRLEVRPTHGIYRSANFPNLRVIDKADAGAADALNAGINAARYPLFCAVHEQTVLMRDGLRKLVRPFLDESSTVASACAVGVANGCAVSDGYLTQAGLPGSLPGLIQVVETLRSESFGRLGWAVFNAVLTIPESFAVFRKETVIAVGGYRNNALLPNADLVMRLHRLHRIASEPYRVSLLPDTLCADSVPEVIAALAAKRRFAQRGLVDVLVKSRGLLLHIRAGAPGWLAYPFLLLFEGIGPLIEVLAYVLMIAAFTSGLLSLQSLVAFLLVSMGLGLLVSVSALLLDEGTFHRYNRPGQLARLLLAALIENFGYRQWIACLRLKGLWQWLRGT